MKILFQRESYDSSTLLATKNELKVAIPSEYLLKQPSIKYKILYTLVSLIYHDGTSLDIGLYVSDIFDSNKGICWYCDDGNITEISDSPKGVYYKETNEPTKNKNKSIQGSTDVLFVFFIRTSYLTKYSYIYFREFKIMYKSTLMKKLIDEQNVFRSEVMVRKVVNDEIQRSISYIKDEIQNYIENIVLEGIKKEKSSWLHGDVLKQLLTMNPMKNIKTMSKNL